MDPSQRETDLLAWVQGSVLRVSTDAFHNITLEHHNAQQEVIIGVEEQFYAAGLQKCLQLH